MTTIGLVANDQSLEVAVNPVITSGEENTVTLHVDFSEDWNGFGKTAVFFTEKNKNTLYEKVMTSGECIVPSEVMANEGTFLVGIRGVNSTSKQVKTTSLVKYKISQGTPAVIEFGPTPDVYEQLLGSYGKLDSDIAVERARIDNLSTLKEGSTTADAELLDIRVKADGSTATSAGNAVREQFSELKDDLIDLKIGEIHPQSKDFRIGAYENGVFKSHSTRRITVDVGYIAKGTEIYIDSNNQYYTMEIYEDKPKSGVKILQTTGWSDIGKVNVKYSGYLTISVANAKTYEASTIIEPSDYVMDIIVKIPTGLYSSLAETVTDIKRYSIGGKIESFSQYSIEQGVIKTHATRRIHFIVGYCEKGTSFELFGDNKYLAVDVYPNTIDGSTQSVIDSSGWVSSNRPVKTRKSGYVCILVANGAGYDSSTDIIPSDFTGYVMHKSHLDGKLSANDLMTNAFVSTYNSIGSVEEHVKNYAKLFKNIGKGDGFLFFTDLHIIYKEGWEDRLKECLAYIEQVANTTPISFVLNGGDWLGSYDGQDRALYMLSRIAGTMRAKFGERHALILGNHDTNYQGGITQEDGDNHIENGRLSQEAIDNTYSSMRRKSYYRYEAPTFALYIFDTGIEISALTTDYYRNQVKWFAEALKTEKMEHIVIGMHIIYNGQNLLDMANELTKCAKAYNERGSYSYGGETYNYANMTNKVAFAIGGHRHVDSNGVINSIPYVLTVNASSYGSYSTLPFDLCAIDWDNSKLYMYRCELGKDGTTREIDIISN